MRALGLNLRGERWESPAKRAGKPQDISKLCTKYARTAPPEDIDAVLEALRADVQPWGRIKRVMAVTGFGRGTVVRVANDHSIKWY